MTGPGADEQHIAGLLRSRGIGPDAHPQPDAVTTAAAAAYAHTGPAQPPAAAEDWWDALYADQSAPAPAQPDAAAAEDGDGGRTAWMRIPPWWSGRHVDTSPPAPAPAAAAGADDQAADEEEQEQDTSVTEDEAQPHAPAPAPATAARRPPQPRPRTVRSRGPVLPGPRALVDTPVAPRRSLLDAAAAVEPRIRWLILHTGAAAAGYAAGWVDYATRTTAWIDQNGLLTPSGIFWCLLALGCEALRHRNRRARLPVRFAAAVPIASIVTGFALYGTGWQTLDLGV